MNIAHYHKTVIENTESGRKYASLLEDWLEETGLQYKRSETTTSIILIWSEFTTIKQETR